MVGRRRFKKTTSLEDRLAMDAKKNRDRASGLPPGVKRDALLEKARQDEVVGNVYGWLASSELQSPK